MPTFCRHNRFLERCPICSKTLPGGGTGRPAAKAPARAGSSRSATARTRTRPHAEGVQVRREQRAEDDGYRSALVPGLRASADARRLAHEIAFSSGRLLALASDPPGLYGEARAAADADIERATWTCFLIAYLSPAEGEDPFAGIRRVLAAGPAAGAPSERQLAEALGALDLDAIPLGPRTSHDRERGGEVLISYLQWAQRGGTSAAHAESARGTQAATFTGERGWTPQRRFDRVFERLALHGFSRTGRYELLVVLGRLGLYELRPDSLALGDGRESPRDAVVAAAKRLFAIADPLLLQRRARALADAAAVPVEALDLALGNWASPQRATLGFPEEAADAGAMERCEAALGL
jgi:hypothetical protein